MSLSTAHVLNQFSGLSVLVIGEAMLDSYLNGTTERLCREAPVPVVDLTGRTDVPGGAANTAVNLAALGAKVHFLSVVGDDAEGEILKQSLQERGIDSSYVLTQPGRRSLLKQRIVANSQLLARLDQGHTDPISPASEQALMDRLNELFETVQAVIISDYGYGILTPRLLEGLGRLQAAAPRVVVADAKNLAAYRSVGLTGAKPNYGEALRLLNLVEPTDRVTELARHADRFLECTGAKIVALTLDTDGALIFERGWPVGRTFSPPAPHSQATGAGDTYVSALTLALAAGATTAIAAEVAAAAATIILTKEGTAACDLHELKQHFEASMGPNQAVPPTGRKDFDFDFDNRKSVEASQQTSMHPAR